MTGATQPPDLLTVQHANCRALVAILKALHHQEQATILATRNGLKVTVENAKCSQSNAFLQADLFQEYALTADLVTIRVNLGVLLDCLSIFGAGADAGNAATSLRLSYAAPGAALCLLLEEAGVVTECRIKTQDSGDLLDFRLDVERMPVKLILRAEALRQVFTELDTTSDVLEMFVSPNEPHFRLSTFGLPGSTHMDLSRHSDLLESFHCAQSVADGAQLDQRWRYQLRLVQVPVLKALALATHVSLRVEERGFLAMQFMIVMQDKKTCFLEFFCVPDMADDEDEEAENLGANDGSSDDEDVVRRLRHSHDQSMTL